VTEPARQFTIIVESVLRSDETAVTFEEIECFCESKRATVHVESPVGTITFLPTGIRIGPTVVSWQGDPPPELASHMEIVEKADKFVIQPRFGNEIELTRAWPKTSGLLDRIAEGWERQAEQEDQEARQGAMRFE